MLTMAAGSGAVSAEEPPVGPPRDPGEDTDHQDHRRPGPRPQDDETERPEEDGGGPGGPQHQTSEGPEGDRGVLTPAQQKIYDSMSKKAESGGTKKPGGKKPASAPKA